MGGAYEMKMIIGGVYQGKTKFAVSEFGISEIKDGEKCNISEVFKTKCIKNYHILIRRLMDENIDPVEFTVRLCSENDDITVIMNEVGCGIIPIEKGERIWREMCGKCGCIIAENSCSVVRVICGIGTYIKGKNV